MTETRTLQQDKLLPRDSRDFFGYVYIYLLLKTPSLLSENCSPLGRDDVRGHIFAQSGGYWLFIHFGDEAE